MATILIVLLQAAVPASARPQKGENANATLAQTAPATSRRWRGQAESHLFWDKTNVMLFSGVAAIRALDFTSTQHFRSRGINEALLSNSIVDNKPLFAGIEVGGTALSIGVSYWCHRTGHHKLERWVSIVHIGVGASGDIRNYSLGPPR